jgi:threonine dehydratase
MRFAWERHGLVVEPGGAAALAALLAGKVAALEGTVVVVSGGNVDPELHAQIIGAA